MLEEEHPRGAGPLVGCQLRCGVGAWLAGGCRVRGVGVPARVPRPPVGTTREGVRICTGWPACAAFWPDVECRTSHVLGGVVRRVGDDFEKRYGYRPYLLETFVEKDQHAGTSFQAAGWRGETAGRGRQGHAATETPKAVYVWMRTGGCARRVRRWRLAPVWTGRTGRSKSSVARHWEMRV